MSVFSIRHRRALTEGNLDVELDARLRGRLWRLMGRYNESWNYHHIPGDNWTDTTDDFEQVTNGLLDTTGESKLRVRGTHVNLKGWITSGPDTGVLDAVELFYLQVEESRRPGFGGEVNRVLGEENANWRVIDGQFVLIDSVFVHEQLIATSQEALRSVNFEGAAHELLDAQHDFADGDLRGAVHNAGSSFESAMKAALGQSDHPAAKQLINALVANGYLEDLPEELRGGLVNQVLLALPWMRNHLGGHGQGKNKQTVSEPYARLALGLAAVLNEFVVALAIERDASLVKVTDQRGSVGAEDLPEISEADFLPTPAAGTGDGDIPF